MDDKFEYLLIDLFTEGLRCAECSAQGIHYDETDRQKAKEAIRAEVRKLEAALEAERGHTDALLQKAEDEEMHWTKTVFRPMEKEFKRLREENERLTAWQALNLGFVADHNLEGFVKLMADWYEVMGLAEREEEE